MYWIWICILCFSHSCASEAQHFARPPGLDWAQLHWHWTPGCTSDFCLLNWTCVLEGKSLLAGSSVVLKGNATKEKQARGVGGPLKNCRFSLVCWVYSFFRRCWAWMVCLSTRPSWILTESVRCNLYRTLRGLIFFTCCTLGWTTPPLFLISLSYSSRFRCSTSCNFFVKVILSMNPHVIPPHKCSSVQG